MKIVYSNSWRCGITALLILISGWFVYGIAVNKGVIAPPDEVSEADIQNIHTAPKTIATWEYLNREALRLYNAGSLSGTEFLGRMLRWNLSYKRGVDLTGVKLAEVFATIPTSGRRNLLELARDGGVIGGFVSFANSTINGTEHPGTPLYGGDFTGAKFSADDLNKWARFRQGTGLFGMSLRSVDLSWLDQRGIHFTGADLSHSGLRPSFWKPDNLPNWVDRRFERCLMDGLEFEAGNLSGMSLRFADLRGTKMTAQQLIDVARSDNGRGIVGAKLPFVDLSGMDISGISFNSVDLGACVLDQRQLDTIEASK
jgi:uncharacterized protein YjbI with pentapeptide repeats